MGKAAKKKFAKTAFIGSLLDHDGNDIGTITSTMGRLVAKAWEVKRRIDDDKDLLKSLNAELIEAIGPGHVVLLPGIARVACVERMTISVDDDGADVLHQVLGGRYEDLVEEQTRYKPLPKLVDMASDGDNPLADAIRGALNVKVSTLLTYRAAA